VNLQNPREVYGRTLVELGRENPDIVVLEADLGKSTMTCYFEEAFPDRFFEMGIAEANMTSFAAGLSLTGKIPFTNSFAVFGAGRSYDQIRQGICIPRLNVKIVGSSAGLSDFGDGSSHQTVEDVAIMRAIPNLAVLVPADGNETRAMTRAIAAYNGPVYMRITRNDLPDVTADDAPFEMGRPRVAVAVLRGKRHTVAFPCARGRFPEPRASHVRSGASPASRHVSTGSTRPEVLEGRRPRPPAGGRRAEHDVGLSRTGPATQVGGAGER
jgi:transketolase